MICPDCHGAKTYPPCNTCGGTGFSYCCESDQVGVESQTSTCPYCGTEVVSYWVPEGCITRREYVLVANWVYHSICWDRQLEKYPPGGSTAAKLCAECGTNYADPPSKLCPGCEAYQEHTR